MQSLEGLTALQKLDLSGCAGLTSLSFDGLVALQTLDLRGCRGLTALSLTGLTALQELELGGCSGLTSLPDVSSLTNLSIKSIPKHLFEWKKRGFVAYDFLRDGFSADVVELDLRCCSGLTSLPSLDGLTALQELNLGGLSGLKSLPSLDGLTAWSRSAWSTARPRSCAPSNPPSTRCGDEAALNPTGG